MGLDGVGTNINGTRFMLLTLSEHAREHGRCGGGKSIEIASDGGEEIVATTAAAALLYLLLCGQLRVRHSHWVALHHWTGSMFLDLNDALLGGRLFGGLREVTQRRFTHISQIF